MADREAILCGIYLDVKDVFLLLCSTHPRFLFSFFLLKQTRRRRGWQTSWRPSRRTDESSRTGGGITTSPLMWLSPLDSAESRKPPSFGS